MGRFKLFITTQCLQSRKKTGWCSSPSRSNVLNMTLCRQNLSFRLTESPSLQIYLNFEEGATLSIGLLLILKIGKNEIQFDFIMTLEKGFGLIFITVIVIAFITNHIFMSCKLITRLSFKSRCLQTFLSSKTK